jgi:hypothetical protein
MSDTVRCAGMESPGNCVSCVSDARGVIDLLPITAICVACGGPIAGLHFIVLGGCKIHNTESCRTKFYAKFMSDLDKGASGLISQPDQ